MLPCKILESGNVVRVGQKTHVEHQVAIRRHTPAVPETDDVNHDVGFVPPPAETLLDKLAQVVDREFRGIDEQVRYGPDRLQLRPLREYTPGDAPSRAQRVRPARFTEA